MGGGEQRAVEKLSEGSMEGNPSLPDLGHPSHRGSDTRPPSPPFDAGHSKPWGGGTTPSVPIQSSAVGRTPPSLSCPHSSVPGPTRCCGTVT